MPDAPPPVRGVDVHDLDREVHLVGEDVRPEQTPQQEPHETVLAPRHEDHGARGGQERAEVPRHGGTVPAADLRGRPGLAPRTQAQVDDAVPVVRSDSTDLDRRTHAGGPPPTGTGRAWGCQRGRPVCLNHNRLRRPAVPAAARERG
ncbi:hypothetical protein AFE02nite_07900 [Actinotalea fermentans]|uniref:Uncharacterized protein n=1 Tax=Actinotalea fermentans TaxID=43671 RepID=A0A511YV70_9CELL|nr:hypothetical protein AFE02nite_07900 [Actinotalea fermentans]